MAATKEALIQEAIRAGVARYAGAAVPTGTMLPFAGTSIPSGYLLCNGANVSRTTYAALFKVIGTKWGAGDGSTTFSLPNVNNRVLEGTTDGTKVGTYLEAGLPNITGLFSNKYRGVVGYTGGAFTTKGWSRFRDWGSSGSIDNYDGAAFDASRSNQLFGQSQSVQPKAVQTLIIIKV